MLYNKYHISLAFSALLIAAACTEKTEYNVLQGDLIGYAYTLGGSGFEYDKDMVKVTLEGSAPLRTTLTDSTLRYNFENLNSGTYNIVLEKEGFCSHKILAYTFVGGEKVSAVPQQVGLYEKPKVTVSNLRLSSNSYWDNMGNIVILANGVLDSEYEAPQRNPKFFRYFMSNKPSVTHTDYLQTDNRTNMDLKDGEMDIKLRIDPSVFPIGTDIYVIVYPTFDYKENEYANRYLDLNTGLYIYSSIDFYRGSDVAIIKVPDPDDNTLWW